MTVPVLIHPNCDSLAATEGAIKIINHLQRHFRLELQQVRWLPNGSKRVADSTVMRLVETRSTSKPVLAVIQNPLGHSTFDTQSRNVWIMSTSQWDQNYGPPPVKILLVFLFVCALAAFAGDIPEKPLREMSHRRRKMRGCIFDYTRGRRELRLDLVAAHMCAECEARLTEWGVTDKPIEAIVEILAYVRAFAIRRPRSTPSYVFIGHGRRKDWEDLRDFLKNENLKVDEFNADPTAGLTNVERLTEMLNSACFAILVMTAEDRQVGGGSRARQNVVHEIGLFQGRLGFKKSIIVMEKSVTKFSNIDGLTYISYPRGKIRTAFSKIRETLIREGVLDPPIVIGASSSRRLATKRTV
jgi:Predicted nucleotide-binding protein containing TIR-like domain